MSDAPLPEALLAQLESLAQARKMRQPRQIMADARSALESKKPKRPRLLAWWTRGE